MLFGTTTGKTYRALFAIRGDVVHILCVRGPGQRRVKAKDIDPYRVAHQKPKMELIV
jgi:hypothetical protein